MLKPNIPKAPAPWSLRGQTYCFVHGTRAPSADPAHNENPEPANRPLMGGLGGILLFRYTSSPVGPYDELIIVPGAYGYQRPRGHPSAFSSFGSVSQWALRHLARGIPACRNPSHSDQLSERSFGISQIYVSTEASTKNGRQNWSIPKKKAVFQWEQDSKTGTAHVSVSLPRNSNSNHMPAEKQTLQPFLKASIKPLTPHIYMPRPLVPSIFRRILQPALPEQAPVFTGEAGSNASSSHNMSLQGQEHQEQLHSRAFVSTRLDVSAQIGLCKLRHLWTDGVEVPSCDTLQLAKVGCNLKKLNLTFNVPSWYWLASVFDKRC